MPADTTIHPFPELRALAKEEAMSRIDTAFRVATCFSIHGTDAAKVELTLLCDLTRRASRDAVCRLVGERVGWDGHSVALSVETGGVNVHALFRDCGVAAEPSLNAAADLALIVRHLWPEIADDR